MPKQSPFRPLSLAAIISAALFSLASAVPNNVSAQGNKSGLDIKVRAENRSADDTPALCPGVGSPGLAGDRLDVDVSTGIDGTPSGTAVFTGADGTSHVLNVDKVFVYFGGVALMDSTTRDTVAIWLGNVEEDGPNLNPVHVSLEVPRGCQNTVATFTVDADKVTTQIKFQ
jgi:hypothetical protein